MEHNEAVELKAAEKYVLRELPEDLREAYEEHFLGCAECAADITAAAAFAETSREIFAEEHNRPASETNRQRGTIWLRWLRPVIAVPVFAALVALVLVTFNQSYPYPWSGCVILGLMFTGTLIYRAWGGEQYSLRGDDPPAPPAHGGRPPPMPPGGRVPKGRAPSTRWLGLELCGCCRRRRRERAALAVVGVRAW